MHVSSLVVGTRYTHDSPQSNARELMRHILVGLTHQCELFQEIIIHNTPRNEILSRMQCLAVVDSSLFL